MGDWGGDAAHYILLGQALSQCNGYVDHMVPGAPAHTKYPLLFPLMLAPIIKTCNINFMALRIEVIIIALLAIIAWYYYFYSKVPNVSALLLAFILALHPYSVNFVTRTLSETPFMLWSGLALYFFTRWSRTLKLKHLSAMMLMAILAYLTRTAGLALMAALSAAVFLKPELRRARVGRIPAWIALGLGFFIPFAVWTGYVSLNSGASANYFAEFSSPFVGQALTSGVYLAGMARRILVNAGAYFYLVPRELLSLTSLPRPAMVMICLAVWSVLIAGAWISWRKGATIEVIYTIITFIMILLWPEYLEFRFLYPLLPLFLLFGYRLGAWVKQSFHRTSHWQAVVYIPAVSYALVCLVSTFLLIRSEHVPDPYPTSPVTMYGYHLQEPLADWSKTYYSYRTPEKINSFGEFLALNHIASLIASKPKVLASVKWRNTTLITGHPTVALPELDDMQEALDYLARWKVTFLIVDNMSPFTLKYTVALIQAYPQFFTKVAGDPYMTAPAIYRFDYRPDSGFDL